MSPKRAAAELVARKRLQAHKHAVCGQRHAGTPYNCSAKAGQSGRGTQTSNTEGEVYAGRWQRDLVATLQEEEGARGRRALPSPVAVREAGSSAQLLS